MQMMQKLGFKIPVNPETLKNLDNARDNFSVKKKNYQDTPNLMYTSAKKLIDAQIHLAEKAYVKYSRSSMTTPLDMRDSPLTERKAKKLIYMLNKVIDNLDKAESGRFNSPEKELAESFAELQNVVSRFSIATSRLSTETEFRNSRS